MEALMDYKVPLVLTPQPEGGYTVTSPLLPELVTEGDSISQAIENIQDALATVIELYEDTGRPLPPNTQIGMNADYPPSPEKQKPEFLANPGLLFKRSFICVHLYSPVVAFPLSRLPSHFSLLADERVVGWPSPALYLQASAGHRPYIYILVSYRLPLASPLLPLTGGWADRRRLTTT